MAACRIGTITRRSLQLIPKGPLRSSQVRNACQMCGEQGPSARRGFHHMGLSLRLPSISPSELSIPPLRCAPYFGRDACATPRRWKRRVGIERRLSTVMSLHHLRRHYMSRVSRYTRLRLGRCGGDKEVRGWFLDQGQRSATAF